MRPAALALPLVALLFAASSGHAQPVPAPADAGVSAPPTAPPIPPDDPATRTFGAVSEAQILEAIRTGAIRSRRPVGSTSVNLHLDVLPIDGRLHVREAAQRGASPPGPH